MEALIAESPFAYVGETPEERRLLKRVAAKIASGLATTRAARPQLAKDAQKELLRGPAVLPSFAFTPEALVRSYVLHRHDVSMKQLTSSSASAIYQRMKADVETLGTAMRAHLEQ